MRVAALDRRSTALKAPRETLQEALQQTLAALVAGLVDDGRFALAVERAMKVDEDVGVEVRGDGEAEPGVSVLVT